MSTKTPRSREFDIDDLISELDDSAQALPAANTKWGIYLLFILTSLILIGGGLWFLSSNSDEGPSTSSELLGPTEAVESFGWEELDSVCLNNRIIGAAPLKGICGPTWEKIFTQITQFVPGPSETEIVTVTETQTVFRPGNRVYLAERDPRAREGIAGDVFINKSTGDLYRKLQIAGATVTWQKEGNLRVTVTVTRTETVTQTVVVTETVITDGEGQGQANFQACDNDVSVAVKPGFEISGWYVSEVIFSNISDACDGKTLEIQFIEIGPGEVVVFSNLRKTLDIEEGEEGEVSWTYADGDLTPKKFIDNSKTYKIDFAIYN